eukprot:TRINITY_DN8278_c0_g1_i1.p1 TRINITY_DN8278_c0_g1~~TRINITY_DN8278_c0_g1_i1.p1  ORF type:complete len:353 (-),score=31.02 TRINITY_DN8278_c0_g1_i1:540-1598(-)
MAASAPRRRSSRTSPVVLLAAVPLACFFALAYLATRIRSATNFLAATDAIGSVATTHGIGSVAGPAWNPLHWLHYDVMIKSHSAYPVALMIGFTCFGNVLLRKECHGKPYANWLFGYLLGFVCYTYPGAVFSDLTFISGAPIRCMSNNNVLLCYSIWFILVQYVDLVYKFLNNKHVLVILSTWWLADATRASMCFLERAVDAQPVFARGVFQCFIWCGAGPIARLVEKGLRGEPLPPLCKLQPNSLNAFKYPLVAMWMTMFSWLVYLGYFSGCNVFGTDDGPRIGMVECGAKHDEMYALLTYFSCGLNIARNYQGVLGMGQKGVFWGDSCWGSCWAFVHKHEQDHQGAAQKK